MSDNGYAGTTLLLAFVAGAASGAVVALLVAPKSGRETREDIRQLGSKVARTALQVPSAMRAAYDSASCAAVEAFNENLRESGNGPSRAGAA
jgi:gas vesicle protein